MSTNDAEPKTEDAETAADAIQGGEGDTEGEGAQPNAAEDSSPSPESTETSASAEGSESTPVESAPAAVAAATAAKPAKAATPAKAAEMTPGQRLAAQKAAKAAQKAAQRGREAELAQDKAIEAAEETTKVARSWVEQHYKLIGGLLAGAVAVVALGAGAKWLFTRDDYAAGGLLWKATEATMAEVRAADATDEQGGPDDNSLRFRTAAAREREALARYQRVESRHPDAPATLFARLGHAATLLGQEKVAEARAEYERVAAAENVDPILEAQALEGVGVTYLEQRDYAKAKQKFDELRTLDHNRFQNLADYHLARVLYAQGQNDQAKQKLQGLLERLGEDDAPDLAFVQQQAELLLQQIDPSSAPRASQGGGMNLDNLTPEQLQLLLRQMQGGGQ